MKTNHIKLAMIGLIAVIFNTANAQSDQRDEPAFGVKAGINISNLYDTKGEDFSDKSKIGFAGGVFVSIPIGTYLGFQPEVLYSQKGYKGSGNIILADYEYTRNVDYLDIPLLLQIKPIPGLSLLAGPQFSFLLHKGLSFDSGNITVEQQTEIRNNNIRKNILGVTGGLDIELHPIVISGRVGWDLQHNNGDGTSTDPRFKNVWIQTTLGLKF
jgi:Outer membrane protein beta-barrel domain